MDEHTDIRIVNSTTLAFGISVVMVLVVVICGVLVLGLYSMSSRYLDTLEVANQRQQEIHTLTRALDRAEGKLNVYEAYITDRSSDLVHKLIVKYLKKEKLKSDKVTLDVFERWVGRGGR